MHGNRQRGSGRQTPIRVEPKVNDADDGRVNGIPALHRATARELVALSSFEDNAADVAKSRNVYERCSEDPSHFANAVACTLQSVFDDMECFSPPLCE